MENFKVVHFKNEWPNKVFPKYSSLNEQELSIVQDNLLEKLSLAKNRNLLKLIEKVDSIALLVNDANAENDKFCLLDLLSSQSIQPNDFVYLNWYRYDDVDQMQLIDLDKNFDCIWYPGTDDLDIFDDSYSWILY